MDAVAPFASSEDLMKVAFFGCWSRDRLGHFLYGPDGSTLQSFGPFIPESLDGVFLRRGHRIPGQTDLTFFKEFVVMAFEDNTADQRPGSNGAFILSTYDPLNQREFRFNRREIWREAEKVYPQIVARLKPVIRMEDY